MLNEFSEVRQFHIILSNSHALDKVGLVNGVKILNKQINNVKCKN